MGETENALPPSKKRAAGRELSRDNPGLDDEEESSEQETGTFKRASDEVLAGRRIVKVRRQQTLSTPSAPSSNPFAGIRLVPSNDSNSVASETPNKVESEKIVSEQVDGKNDATEEADKAKGDDEQAENKDENDKEGEKKADEAGAESAADEKKDNAPDEGNKPELAHEKAKGVSEAENKDNSPEGSAEKKDKKDNGTENVEKGVEAASFNSFQQLSSSQNAFTGLAGTGFSSSSFSFGSIAKDGSALGTSIGTKNEGSRIPSMQEVSVETGEENEKAVFAADSVLFEFTDGGWKERGKGEVKVNISRTGTGKARLVMRAKGNYRLILNASLYPDMKLTNMEKRGITFACMNSAGEGKNDLATFALKFKDGSIVEEFRRVVTEHKGRTPAVLKTPENSPKASDE